MSNIAAGSTDQIKTLMHHKLLLQMIVQLARDAEWDVRKEAIWAVANICTLGTEIQVQCFVEFQSLETLCNVLNVRNEAKMILVALDAIQSILTVGDKFDRPYKILMDECGGIDSLEELQTHPEEKIYEKCCQLIEVFFGAADEDENLAPTAGDDAFVFGLSSPAKNLFGAPSPSPSPSSHMRGALGNNANFNIGF